MQLLGKLKQANIFFKKKKENKDQDMGFEPLTLGLSVLLLGPIHVRYHLS